MMVCIIYTEAQGDGFEYLDIVIQSIETEGQPFDFLVRPQAAIISENRASCGYPR